MEKFPIDTTGTRTTDEVIAATKYCFVTEVVNGKNFPMRPMPEGPREIVFLRFDLSAVIVSTEMVLAEAQRQGLEQPRYEDALFFGEQYPEEYSNAHGLVFLHEPQHLGTDLVVLALWSGMVGRRHLRQCSSTTGWPSHCWFAFVRKS